MSFPSQIFKAYDIRGLVEGELSEELFYRIGRAAVVYTAAKRVFVGYDMRPSSCTFADALIRGLIEQGADVTDIGLISTPMLNILTMLDPRIDLGVMITASHNPQEYNGCKFVNKKTMMPIGLESGLADIRDLVTANVFPTAAERGSVGTQSLEQTYLDFVFAKVDTRELKPLKVVIDMGNGIEGVIIDEVMKRLPVAPDYLFKEPDGRFPNHEANPLKYETLKDLQARIVVVNADLGFAFDGDADRVGLVDETGQIVPGDLILALVAGYLLEKHPKEKIIYDVKCSRTVSEIVREHGGTPVESVVGRTFVIAGMRETKALFGGELSCHFYFRDLFGFESGDLMLLLVLKIVSESGKRLSELIAPLRRYAHSGEINFEVADKDGAIRRIEQVFAPGATTVSHLDGVKIEFPDWWLSIRKSNTEPLLRLCLEAKTPELMEAKVREIEKLIRE